MAARSKSSETAEVVMPVGDLHGRSVWTEDGRRLGAVSSVETDPDGRVVALNVRERWILGHHRTVPAAGMRLDAGDVVVPTAAIEGASDYAAHDDADVLEPRVDPEEASRAEVPTGPFAPELDQHPGRTAPAAVTGRAGARDRFGGFDVVASFLGGLVIIASLVLVGGLLAAIFDTGEVNVDTSVNSPEALATGALIAGAVTLFISALLGGWNAGRSARFDGAGNGIAAVVWALSFGVAFAALGWWLGSDHDIMANIGLPTFTTDEFALWGSVAMATAFLLLLLGGALGGLMGERWHRRVDHALLGADTTDDDRATRGVTAEHGTHNLPVTADEGVRVDRV